MSGLWSGWRARCDRQEDPTPLALVRILACSVVVVDLLRAAALGLVPVFWRTYEAGGLSRITGARSIVDDWSPEWGGPAVWLVTVLSMTLGALGVATRPALLVGLLAYAQLGHLYPPGDRAIDRLLRTVIFVLLFSGAHRRLSLQGWLQGRAPPAQIGGWASDLLRFELVLVYLGAGFLKLGADIGWLIPTEFPPLYRILADPMAGRLDPVVWADWTMLFYLGGVVTILLEISAPLLLIRLAPAWAVAGLFMHLGIAAGMHLGMFSWGILSLYPLFFGPYLLGRWKWRGAPGGGGEPGRGPAQVMDGG